MIIYHLTTALSYKALSSDRVREVRHAGNTGS
jgi:hypothetical protein